MHAFTRLVCLAPILLLQAARAGAVPTLVIKADPETELTWKQVFDAGFRPKYLGGMGDRSTVCYDQSIILKREPDGPGLLLPPGRLKIDLAGGTRIRMLWHLGREAITLDEGALQIARFKKVFGACVTRDIVMPRVIDPSGMIGIDEERGDVIARVGPHLIYYGFVNSFRADRPIIPQLHVFRDHSQAAELPRNQLHSKVMPPEGYKWYSLDPTVDTPAPGIWKPVAPPAEMTASSLQPWDHVANRLAATSPELVTGIVLFLILAAIAAVVHLLRSGRKKPAAK